MRSKIAVSLSIDIYLNDTCLKKCVYKMPPHAFLRGEVAVTCLYRLIPSVGVMVVVASAATFMPATGKSKIAKVKDMTMRNRPIGELGIVRSRIGVVIGAVGAVNIGAVNAVCTIESIGVDAGFTSMDKSAAPVARILVVLGASVSSGDKTKAGSVTLL